MTRRAMWCATVAIVSLTGPVAAQYAGRGGPGQPVGPYPGQYAPGYYGGPIIGGMTGPAGAAQFTANYRAAYGMPAAGAYTPVRAQVPPPVYYPPMTVYQPPRPPSISMPEMSLVPSGRPGNFAMPATLVAEPQAPVPPPAASGVAHFTVTVTADAKLWVNDAETKQAGDKRRFHTPTNLETGRTYEYTFRAQWPEGGQTVTRDRTVRFKAGDDLTVDLNQAPGR